MSDGKRLENACALDFPSVSEEPALPWGNQRRQPVVLHFGGRLALPLVDQPEFAFLR